MRIFVLGNGFDLHHKLPTTYLNFLNTAYFLTTVSIADTITVGDVFGNRFFQENDKQIAESYQLYKDEYNKAVLNSDGLLRLIQLAKTNLWFSFFRNSFNKELGWIDFEKEIANVVAAFRELLSLNKIEFNLEEIHSILFQRVIKHFNFFWQDNEIQQGIYGTYIASSQCKKFKDEYLIENPYGSKNLEINKEKIITYLNASLRELAEMLTLYLSLFVDNTVKAIAAARLIQKKESFSSADFVFSFNYTKTFIYLYSYSNGIAYIHGPLDREIVLGINPDEYDELKNLDTTFLCFKKYFQRIFFASDYSYRQLINRVLAGKRNKKSIYLQVVGHSLDVTDEDILKELFDLSDKITIFYHKASNVQSYIQNLLSIYGKKEFDRIRIEKHLKFLPLEEIDVLKQEWSTDD